MNIKGLNVENQLFGKYVKPDNNTQSRINRYITENSTNSKNNFLTDEFVQLVEAQKNNKNTTIQIVCVPKEKDMYGDSLQVIYSSNGKKVAESTYIHSFEALVKQMKHYGNLVDANKSAIDKVSNVWDS